MEQAGGEVRGGLGGEWVGGIEAGSRNGALSVSVSASQAKQAMTGNIQREGEPKRPVRVVAARVGTELRESPCRSRRLPDPSVWAFSRGRAKATLRTTIAAADATERRSNDNEFDMGGPVRDAVGNAGGSTNTASEWRTGQELDGAGRRAMPGWWWGISQTGSLAGVRR
jgi:hypothetical protein